ncbi:hypothetical protein pb186bvf_017349 [Paramecium bursaria]
MSYQPKLSDKEKEIAFNRILKKQFNSKCADCGANSPTWVSIDFGVFVCYNCSGAHRNLGQHITRVRSTQLDSWNQDQVDMMDAMGNDLNEYWEDRLPKQKKADPSYTLEQRQAYVNDKYVKRLWIKQGVAEPKVRYTHCQLQGIPFKADKPQQQKSQMQVIKTEQSLKQFYSDNGSNNKAVADAVKQFKTTQCIEQIQILDQLNDFKTTQGFDLFAADITKIKTPTKINLLSPEKKEKDWTQQAVQTSVQTQFNYNTTDLLSFDLTPTPPQQPQIISQQSAPPQNKIPNPQQFLSTPGIQIQQSQFNTYNPSQNQNQFQPLSKPPLYQAPSLATNQIPNPSQFTTYTPNRPASFSQAQHPQSAQNSYRQPQQQFSAQQPSWTDAVNYANNPFATNDIMNLYGKQNDTSQGKYDALRNNPFV